MAKMLINSWGGGIGDDPFLSRPGECLDMDSIDIRITPRRIKSIYGLSGSSATATLNASDTLYKTYESIAGTVQLYGSNMYIGTYNITSVISGGGINAVSIGRNLDTYNVTTNPEGLRHFVFQNNTANNYIKIIDYVGLYEHLRTTIDTTTISTNTDNSRNKTTAVVYLWEGAILFSRNNLIYEINPTTEIVNTTPKIKLQIGAQVKYMYYSNGQIVIVYNIGYDTYIQSCLYDGSTYTLQNYADITKNESCIDAYGNNGKIYWVSRSGIWIYQGISQLVKVLQLSTSARLSYGKGILRISDGFDLYEYGINKPGYGNPLTKVVSPYTIVGLNESTEITYNGTNQFYIDDRSRGYSASSYYILHPYTAGQYGWKKTGLKIRIGCALPKLSTYSNQSTLCSITIGIQTDMMERVNTVNYTTIATITDADTRFYDITQNMIAKALETAGYTTEFGYFRLKITLNNGDPYSAFYTKSPEVYDILINHEEIKDA